MWRIKSGIENPLKSEVIGRGWNEKNEWPRRNDKSRTLKKKKKKNMYKYTDKSLKEAFNNKHDIQFNTHYTIKLTFCTWIYSLALKVTIDLTVFSDWQAEHISFGIAI